MPQRSRVEIGAATIAIEGDHDRVVREGRLDLLERSRLADSSDTVKADALFAGEKFRGRVGYACPRHPVRDRL